MILWKTMISGGTLGIGKTMIKRTCLLLIVALTISFKPVSLVAAEIILKSEDQFVFALETMNRKDYLRAVAEFERFVHFFPEDDKVPRARLLIGICYLKARDFESARTALLAVHDTYAGTLTAGKALFWIGESYFRQKVPVEAERYFIMVIENYPEPELKNAALYRLGWSRMQSGRWQEASETFNRVDSQSALFDSSRHLAMKSLEGETLPYKNPTTAGVMAAILPGLGHAYCERYRDGLVAFLLNGLFIWAAVEAFDENHDVLGGILLFVEAGWYAGNIYSAVNCAHKHNRHVKNQYLRMLPDRLDLNLFTSGRGHYGLVLKVDF
jgi:outer membrane protein assembly factor BamD (BamD/ComL family)